MKVGIIGAGDIGQRLARHFLSIGNEVILCNSRGPETLKETVVSL
ncbi:MAG: NAD(P)-binding domain-containing protein, partial [Clostridia bacterium]|nr:NAD(P)-binding domain-containing protein [Clostridia bacterium]